MKTKIKEEVDRAREQAKAQLESIIEMVDEMECAERHHEEAAIDEARETIQEDPLSVQVREDWHAPREKVEAFEFEILLCTGGPAVRILGELNEHSEPSRAWIQYQDWGTPWTDYMPSMITEENEKLLTYCQQFYFGD